MTTSARTLFVLLTVAAMAVLAVAAPAHADATIEPSEIQNGYPTELTFPLTATAPVDITDVTLRYTILGTGVAAIGKPEPGAFTPGTSVTTSVKIETNPNTEWVPVGNRIEWHWELALADGTTTIGPTSTYLYLPPDKDWKTVEDENAIVFYTGPREGLADEMLQAIDETYEEHGRQLLKTELEQTPVTVIIMGSAADLSEAQPSEGRTLDNSTSVVTCGFRPGNSTQLIFGTVSCGGSDPVETIRHEFAHILSAAAGEGSLVTLPTWISEGLAVYAQESADTFVDVFQTAARRNRLIPFSEMGQKSAEESQVILQYGQGYAMTAYLIDTYGVPKLNELLDLTKANTRFDTAFEETYGMDLDGFEEEFLAAVGAGAAPTAQPTRQERPSEPTPAPTSRPQQQPQQPTAAPAQAQFTGSSDDDGGMSSVTIVLIGLAVLLALAAIMSFLLMMFLQNQRTGRGA